MTTPAADHRPESWFWEAGSVGDDHCPHGPEPDRDSPEWDTWGERHTGSPQDVYICLDAPAGDYCHACSEEMGEGVPWADCRARDRHRTKHGAVSDRPARHAPITLLVGRLDCLDRECDDYFTADGIDRPEVEQCTHVTEETVCAGCSTEASEGYWTATVAWSDCPRRPLAAPAKTAGVGAP